MAWILFGTFFAMMIIIGLSMMFIGEGDNSQKLSSARYRIIERGGMFRVQVDYGNGWKTLGSGGVDYWFIDEYDSFKDADERLKSRRESDKQRARYISDSWKPVSCA